MRAFVVRMRLRALLSFEYFYDLSGAAEESMVIVGMVVFVVFVLFFFYL